ncbi:MAG TPA: RsmB/NOP family class I SAM-dependent RNA methyltransferase [Sphingobium sp.]|nr:RsmB/NOP family class I SAM-dependent RNA methyltransferase [Sphingobium sp.]
MTPAARVQAAIDLLDAIIAAAAGQGAAADTIIQRYFKERRYAGAKDRRAVRDLIYAAIRAHAAPPASGRAAMIALARDDAALADLFDGSRHGPAPITAEERTGTAAMGSAIPEWLLPHLAPLVDRGEQAALLGRAALHVRVNALKSSREAVGAALPGAVPLATVPHGLALPEGTPLEATAEWQAGLIEVQDAGSQYIAAACAARPGQTVLDLCAGAGGKTLALAADMGGEGRLIAADINRDRLKRLAPRAQRAGAGFIETLLLDGGREAEALAPLAGACDCVLVDAPCTGMGTWRRNPEARWRLSPDMLARAVAQQARVLDLAAPLVKPGGLLVYAVCSLLDPEGRDQLEAFLGRSSDWVAEPLHGAGRSWGAGRLLTPALDGSDGFFVARLRKAC